MMKLLACMGLSAKRSLGLDGGINRLTMFVDSQSNSSSTLAPISLYY